MALTSKLSAIGDAIREKNGTSDLMTLDAMVEAIAAIETGGGVSTDLEVPVLTGWCNGYFKNGNWDWLLNQIGNKFSTRNIESAQEMFLNSAANIPFSINIVDGCDCSTMFFGYQGSRLPKINGAIGSATQMFSAMGSYFNRLGDFTFDNSQPYECGQMFYNSFEVREIGTLTNLRPVHITGMFEGCHALYHLPTFVNLDLSNIHENNWMYLENMFMDCRFLLEIPESFLKEVYSTQSESWSGYFNSTFMSCYSLGEIRGLSPQTPAFDSNKFQNTFNECYRVKDIIFDMQENGHPYMVSWKNQTIDLHWSAVGWAGGMGYSMIGGNNYITADKEVKDDATYQALKNDPYWWTERKEYSRYNHDSAVNTINSLPECATLPSGNTIKFRGACGSKTDGGAINTLTEEEIAVAAAKGWTVALA